MFSGQFARDAPAGSGTIIYAAGGSYDGERIRNAPALEQAPPACASMRVHVHPLMGMARAHPPTLCVLRVGACRRAASLPPPRVGRLSRDRRLQVRGRLARRRARGLRPRGARERRRLRGAVRRRPPPRARPLPLAARRGVRRLVGANVHPMHVCKRVHPLMCVACVRHVRRYDGSWAHGKRDGQGVSIVRPAGAPNMPPPCMCTHVRILTCVVYGA